MLNDEIEFGERVTCYIEEHPVSKAYLGWFEDLWHHHSHFHSIGDYNPPIPAKKKIQIIIYILMY